MALAPLLLLAALAAAAPLQDPAVQPALPTGLDVQDRPFPALTYERFPAPPPSKPLAWDAVIQGQLGSCFFLSTLAALAKTRPELVAGSIRGRYTVRLHDLRGRPVDVAVDDQLPVAAPGQPFFARGAETGEIRPALFEKAFAKLRGGYDAANGGESADAFLALTGARGRDTALAGVPVERVWRLLGRAARAGRPITASTPDAATLRRLTGREDLAGLIDDHVYVVLGADLEEGRQLVRLYTPLTPADAGYGRDGSRLVALPVADFARLFDSVTLGPLSRD